MLTTNAGHDADQADGLLEEVPGEIDSVTADGAFDKWKVYHAIERRGARPNIPPRHDAKIKRHANAAGPRLARDEAIRMIRRIGRKTGKKALATIAARWPKPQSPGLKRSSDPCSKIENYRINSPRPACGAKSSITSLNAD